MCWIATGLLLLCSQKVGELSVSCLLAQIHRAFRLKLEPDGMLATPVRLALQLCLCGTQQPQGATHPTCVFSSRLQSLC